MVVDSPEVDRAAELELVDAALLGDMEAFADLFERYRKPLHSLCLKRLGDHSLAEDIVQEVFVRSFISLPNSDHRKPIWPWLATIAVRMCIDLKRRRSLTDYSADIELAVDAAANREALEGQTASALDAVIASERRAELWESLRVLPRRQRRVFLIYAVDGWTCAEIAEAEGISVDAVHHLLFRARKKMRSVHQSGPLPAIVFPFNWLGWKLQRIEERIRIVLGVYSEGFSAACVQAVCLGTVVAMVVAASRPTEPLNRDDAATGEAVASATQTRQPQTAWPPTALSNIGAPAKAPVKPQQSATSPAGSLVDEVINPNQSATPETTHFDSIAASPNYESDHMVLALGEDRTTSALATDVLFASSDGGGSWQPRPSRLLKEGVLALPPDFPQDNRVFVLEGNLGLQQSDDGGEIFRLVSPLAGGRGVAISPTFVRGGLLGDSRILMGGLSIREYDAGTGVTSPSLLPIPPALTSYSSIAFSPSYQIDSTVFVSDWATFYRCRSLICDKTQLQYPGPLGFRFSSQCDQAGLAYAFTRWKLLVSHDGAQTFEEIQFPLKFPPLYYSESRSIFDLAVLCKTSSDPAIFVTANWIFHGLSRSLSGIYRSFDAGRSWSRTLIDLPGFDFGAHKLIVTPTGRLLATGTTGIACSIDGGQTWAPRCTPEP